MKCSSLILATCAVLLNVAPGHCADHSAGGMSVEQEKRNPAISYWFELKRKNKITRVDDNSEFQSGDKLRIHVKSNVDGYAYIFMVKGSQGDTGVLFPEEESASNRVKAGAWITLPAGKDTEDWLKFDEKPGTERLRMFVSRTKIDPNVYLNEAAAALVHKDDVSDTKVTSTENEIAVDVALTHKGRVQ